MMELHFNPHAVPPGLAALMVFLLGTVTLVRERGSYASLPFSGLVASLTLWLFGLAMLYSSATPAASGFWVHIGTLGVAMTPAAALYFCLTLVNRKKQHQAWLWATLIGSVIFLLTSVFASQHIAAVQQMWWGPYPKYGLIGVVFIVYISAVLTGCMWMLWQAHQAAPKGSTMAKRIRMLLAGTMIGCLAASDLIATQGFDVYPLGFLPISIMFMVMLYCTWNYHLFDVTPSLAGPNILDTMTEAVIGVDDARTIRVANPAAVTVLEQPRSALIGSDIATTLRFDLSESLVNRALGGETVRDVETLFLADSGSVKTLQVSASPLRSRGGKIVAAILVLADATERRRAEERIRFLAYNDALTLLPNRAQFEIELGRMIREADRAADSATLFFLDLDRFKRINDSMGHESGDQLLRIVARRLSHCIRGDAPSDRHDDGEKRSFVARLGGDEFAVVLRGIRDTAGIERIAQRIQAAFAEPFAIGKNEVFVGTSIGVSVSAAGKNKPETLLQHADIAMYSAKDKGRNSYAVYQPEMESITVEGLQLEADLRRALELGQLELHFQPQIDFATGLIMGAEALLRWRHPQHGQVSPGDFMHLAEDTGLIIPIGRWVLREACRTAMQWQSAGQGPLKIAVNISERQFRGNDLLADVATALDLSGLPASCLELELTESIIMRNAEDTIEQLAGFKRLGARISVDDFGTGYSSLSYLKRFPIDVIKIDRSFVKDLAVDEEDRAITRAIIALALSLNRAVIAEGVESRRQADILSDMGCTLMQGYLFGRPVPADQFAVMLQQHGASTRSSGTLRYAAIGPASA